MAGLAVLRKRLRLEDRGWLAAGLSAVVVDPAHRGSGHGVRLCAAARRWILDGDADLGIFTCDRPLVPFYERAGWHVLPGRVLVGGTPEHPFASDGRGMDKVVVAAWRPREEAVVRAAFTARRIPLHPGEIDRLW